MDYGFAVWVATLSNEWLICGAYGYSKLSNSFLEVRVIVSSPFVRGWVEKQHSR